MATEEDRAGSIKQLSGVLSILVSASRVDEKICDPVLAQYKQFLNTVLADHQQEFLDVDPSSGRLDELLCRHLSTDRKSVELWAVMK